MVFDLSPTWSNLSVCPCLSTPSTQVRALKLLASRSAWIKALHYRKRKQHMLSLFYMGLNGFPLMHACVNVRFPSPLARQRRHAWPRITPGDRMGTRTYAHFAGAREARCRGRRLPRRLRWAQWKDVEYCFSPWGDGARAARGERHGFTHVTSPMTDGGKSWTSANGKDPKRDLELFAAVDIMRCYQWHKVMWRRKGYENDLHSAGAAKMFNQGALPPVLL